MKKIFTCISLAAATFMATTPVMAQQQKQLTDKEKAAVVKVIVPAVFDQVKQISGVDFMSLANPNIENVINSPLFLPQVSSLRADQLNTISATPDSLKLNLSSLDFSKILPPDYAGMGDIIAGLVNDVKLSFSNYKEYNVTVNGINVKIELPEKIDVSAAAIDAELVGLSFAVKEKEAFYVAIPANREEALKIVNIFKPPSSLPCSKSGSGCW